MANRILKWGNSDGIRIPKVYMEKLGLKTGDLVDFKNDDEKLIITKSTGISLKSRIEQYKDNIKIENFEWNDCKGREIW